MTWELHKAPMEWPADTYQLVYMDPPFNSGRDYKFGGEFAFADRFASQAAYAQHLRQWVLYGGLWESVAPGGSLVIHIDPRHSANVRMRLDMEHCLASEIVWRYRRWPTKTANFQRVHDTLLRYVKPGANPVWNQLYEPLAASTQKVWGTRRQRAVTDETGRRARSSTTDEASPGTPMGDVWEIPIIAPSSRERTGWPTQKPEALLERLILALTNPGDSVMDPCCGSGTTVAVAHRLRRHGVGADISDMALSVARARLVDG